MSGNTLGLPSSVAGSTDGIAIVAEALWIAKSTATASGRNTSSRRLKRSRGLQVGIPFGALSSPFCSGSAGRASHGPTGLESVDSAASWVSFDRQALARRWTEVRDLVVQSVPAVDCSLGSRRALERQRDLLRPDFIER